MKEEKEKEKKRTPYHQANEALLSKNRERQLAFR